MQAISRQTLFRSLLLSAVVAVGLSVGGCDLFGSDDGASWTGNWEVVSGGGFDTTEGRYFYSLSKEEVELIYYTNVESSCYTETNEITDIDDNVITTDTGDGDSEEVRVDVSDDGQTLTVTSIDNNYEVTAESIDSDPRDLVDC